MGTRARWLAVTIVLAGAGWMLFGPFHASCLSSMAGCYR